MTFYYRNGMLQRERMKLTLEYDNMSFSTEHEPALMLKKIGNYIRLVANLNDPPSNADLVALLDDNIERVQRKLELERLQRKRKSYDEGLYVGYLKAYQELRELIQSQELS